MGHSQSRGWLHSFAPSPQRRMPDSRTPAGTPVPTQSLSLALLLKIPRPPQTPPSFRLQVPEKPYYNSRPLEDGLWHCQEETGLSQSRKLPRKAQHASGYLRISDVARLVGVSPSILRSWEILGLISPARTRSQYRLYTQADVRLLKRAQFLRRARGMNAPAIVHMLKTQGLLSKSGGSHPKASPVGPRLRRLRLQRGYSLAKVAQAVDVSVGFLSGLERTQISSRIPILTRMTRINLLNILPLFEPPDSNPGRVRPGERKALEAGNGIRME